MSTKIEFAVQMTCDSCVRAVENALKDTPGIRTIDINLQLGTVVVVTTLSMQEVHKLIESSGRKAVIKGIAGSLAAVAVIEFGDHNVQGVVRFVQIDPVTCIIDGTVDGLSPGKYGLFIHETGDISQGCKSVGNCFIPDNYRGGQNQRLYGDLGIVMAEDNGRAAFRLQDNIIKLPEIIGRSLVITKYSCKNNSYDIEERLACGIIARSSGLFQNPKTICACDGISIWDERNKLNSSL